MDRGLGTYPDGDGSVRAFGLSDFFKRGERRSEYDSEEWITVLTDDAPGWLTDAVHEAHGDELPDDWRYATCAAIASALDERDGPDTDDDALVEIADGLVDVYNADRLRWVAGYMTRYTLVDDAVSEAGGIDGDERGILDAIAWAQCAEIERMAYALRDAWRENVTGDVDPECDNCGEPSAMATADGRFCSLACVDAYKLS
jgi:hypothetical protein